ncbi:MAG: WG repeat-containing protein [Defluviitaleaceae bacterium]|nr:WG repeat-containing protein [Defluviitaleaceae bacterium]
MKKFLITTMMLFAIIALAACGNNDNNGNTPESPLYDPPEEENTDSAGMEYTPESDMLIWIVEPTLEHDFIYHCCFFSTDNHSGEFIDSTTGLIVDWPQGLAFGHGPTQGWVYDPAVSLLGFGGIGDYSGIWLLPIHEWIEEFPNIDEEQGLMIVQMVDSSMRNITEFGNEYLSDDAHSGKFAVMLNRAFITDFIFDGGSIRGVNIDVLSYTIPMYEGNTWGFIGKDGNVAIPFLFEHIVRIDDDSAFARYNGKYGILNIPLTIANF